MKKNSRIFVAGHRGLVGSAIWKSLEDKGYSHLIGRTHKELDLEDPAAVREFFDREKPEYVFLAAAFVGGIIANSRYRADFIFRNLQIQHNVIGESFRHGVSKLLFLGSTCIYPREAPQPMKENALLTSPLEYTNEPYAIAKIAGLKMCNTVPTTSPSCLQICTAPMTISTWKTATCCPPWYARYTWPSA